MPTSVMNCGFPEGAALILLMLDNHMPPHACPQVLCLVDVQNGSKTLEMHMTASTPPMPMKGVKTLAQTRLCFPGIMAFTDLLLYINEHTDILDRV